MYKKPVCLIATTQEAINVEKRNHSNRKIFFTLPYHILEIIKRKRLIPYALLP